jgi:hypothetical protein
VFDGGPAPVINTVVRYINPTYTTTHTTIPFDSSGGDLIVMFVSSHAGVAFVPSDNFGNTWTSIAGPTNTARGFDLRSQIWYVAKPKVGLGHIINMRLSTAQPLVVSIFVVKGSNVYSPIDAVSLIGSDDRTRSTNVSSSKVNTTGKNELLLGWVKVSAGASFRSGSGFIQQPEASSDFLDAESGTAAVAGLYAASFMLNKPQTWQSAIVAAANNPNQTILTWQAAIGGGQAAAEYLVERCQGEGCVDFVVIGATASTTYNDAGLNPSTSYSYRVRGRSSDGKAGAYSSVVTLIIPRPMPPLPGNLKATAVSSSGIDLSWSPAGSDGHGTASRYLVDRCHGVDCTDFSPVGTVTGLTYQDRGVLTGVTYNYRVRAMDATGNVGPGVCVVAVTTLFRANAEYIALFAFISVAPWYRKLQRALGR